MPNTKVPLTVTAAPYRAQCTTVLKDEEAVYTLFLNIIGQTRHTGDLGKKGSKSGQ